MSFSIALVSAWMCNELLNLEQRKVCGLYGLHGGGGVEQISATSTVETAQWSKFSFRKIQGLTDCVT
jgi:hypothetical protein